jgi:pyrimidine-nucleoside phosphorylase
MLPQYPWTKSAPKGAEKAGLITIGSFEDKIPFILYPILLTADIVLYPYKNFHCPQDISVEVIDEIKDLIQKKKMKSVVIDLRVQNWSDNRILRHSRALSSSLQDICLDFSIDSSIILSNGDQLIGNAVGPLYEMIEACKVLKGEGPPDLTKFALEISAELLVATKKAQHRRDAKTWLRDKIIDRDFSGTETEITSQASFPTVSTRKIKFSSQKPGYIHHLAMNELHSLRSALAAVNLGIGFSLIGKAGDRIEPGDDIFEVYLPEGQQNPLDEKAYQRALVISSDPPDHQPLILEWIESHLRSK